MGENIQLVVMRKPGLENRADSILKIDIFGLSEGTEKIGIIGIIPQKRALSDCDLGGRNEANSCGQIDFDCRVKSEAIPFFGIFELTRF